MGSWSRRRFLTSLAMLGAGTALPGAAQERAASPAHRAAELLGRGINLGNALEAPREGEWGLTLREEFFPTIAGAGFAHVRVPIRWSAHSTGPAHRIDETFFRRVDWVLEQARKARLRVVLNVHHFEELYADPDRNGSWLTSLWEQIGARYRPQPETVCFELLNEPHGKLDADRWNRLLIDALEAVRATNPRRMVIVGPANWNNPAALPTLKLPREDRFLIGTFHYYSPFEFTHQGASWVPNSDRWLGRKWSGTDAETAAIRRDFDRAAEWGRTEGRPLYLGEFGAYSRADLASRAAWTRSVQQEARKRGFATAYWEFASGFGAYDLRAGRWRPELLAALTG